MAKTYVTMLLNTEDPYWRPRIDYLGLMEPEKDVKDTGDYYIIKKLLVTQKWTQYPVQWLGYGAEHNFCHSMVLSNT